MRISTDFDNGGMARVEQSHPGVFDLWPYRAEEHGARLLLEPRRPHDRDGTEGGARDPAMFTFHFRIDGCGGKKVVLRFHVHEMIERTGYSALYANPDFPVCRTDGASWQRMPRKFLHDDPEVPGGRIVVVEHEFEAGPAWVAFQYPYSCDRLSAWAARARGLPCCSVESCGKSTEGRDIPLVTVTDPAASGPKRSAWLVGIQHSAETGAGWAIEGVMDFLLSDDPLTARARRACVVKAVPVVNVDSVTEGRGRLHPRNLNLNREWEKSGPAAEVAAIRGEMDRFAAGGGSIDLFLDIHGFSGIEDTRWLLLPLAPEGLSKEAAERSERARQSLCRHIPFRVTSGEWPGYAAGMAARRFGAAAFSIDGWVFRSPDTTKAADLSSHFEHGLEVWPLADVKAAGAGLARAIAEALLDGEREDA